ncbi:MAG: hypothetical protein QOG15_1100 [Solirubrobacteraceae bacterium]|jgi:hypothetical protein|nr:hypothetical protein [Solirubrobacteraceae bacterium]
MAEHTPADTDPAEYRGGAPESENAKGGAGEVANAGIVPDEVTDSQPSDNADPQDLDNEVLGDIGGVERSTEVDITAGDNADATSMGSSGGARGSDAGLGRHEDTTIDEDNPDQSVDGGNG